MIYSTDMTPSQARKQLDRLSDAKEKVGAATGRFKRRLENRIAKIEPYRELLEERAAESKYSSFLKNDRRKK